MTTTTTATSSSPGPAAGIISDATTALPPDFIFGAATSAYQIEGATHEDGRGESIWDRFCSIAGNTYQGDSGEVACDHYHRFAEDVRLMRDMGLQAYRFSVAWPRVVPIGRGAVNAKGLDFYDRLVDALTRAGIEPYVTLFHWDLPQALQDTGGWYARDTAEAFGEYAGYVVARLGDRVRHWITHNEPWCSSWLGHGYGVHAPGKKEGAAGAVRAAHHILLSHGYAVEAIRAEAPDANVGITIDLYPMYPLTESEDDRRAAWAADGQRNRWFLDPVLRGRYPSDMHELLSHLPDGFERDMERIGSPLDFLGVNYYERQVIKADDDGRPQVVRQSTCAHAENGREIFPEGLTVILERMHAEHPDVPLYVTENGIGGRDSVDADGQVHDPARVAFLDRHLCAVAKACRAGVSVAGYFAWSFMDNFEWSKGYDERERYGLVYVDRATQRRIVKSSGKWYAEYISRHSQQ